MEFGAEDPPDSRDVFKDLNSSFFHGTYKKYTARLGRANYILKVRQSDCPELPVTEFLSNQAARLLGIPVPPFHFILFQNKLETFLSRNVLDERPKATLQHIYKYMGPNDAFDCETLARVIERETGRARDVHAFVRLCLFDALVGNHDRHGRNLAFLAEPGKRPALSPFYDNPSWIGIADPAILRADLNPKGRIATRATDEPTPKDYMAEFHRLGLGDTASRFRDGALARATDLVGTIREEARMSAPRRTAFIRLVEKRLNEFEHA